MMEKLTLGCLLDKIGVEGLYIVVFDSDNFCMTLKSRRSFAMSHAFDEKLVRDFYFDSYEACLIVFLEDFVVDVKGMG